ncbi:M23 family metallopeptidase [Actinomycetospora sp. CA-101289]|uniref:M23 family metallopeptidase n=1 Tax=Actinomycetospora sp. CA-101289 TaxID=3239893 RepID=UPI003D98BA00
MQDEHAALGQRAQGGVQRLARDAQTLGEQGLRAPSPPLVPATLTEPVAPVTVDRTPPARISPPLRGAGWLDGDSCCRLGAHRGAVSPIDGQLWAPERFAIDYVQTDPAGRMMTGPPTDIASYPYVGSDIFAVADGPVVGLVGDLPQQPPGMSPSGLTLQQYGGDHVVQDIDGGRYAFSAHLQTGNPLNLAVGQQLTRGQVVGKLGNSGNTDAPHLHFHVMDRPDPLAANGLPFEFDSFTLEGRVTSEESLQQGTAGPVPFRIDRRLPVGAVTPPGWFARREHRRGKTGTTAVVAPPVTPDDRSGESAGVSAVTVVEPSPSRDVTRDD